MNRRRNLITTSIKNKDIIRGNELTWEQGYLNNGILDSSYTTWISCTDYIPFTSGRVLTYIGPESSNNIIFKLYVYCYDEQLNYLAYYTVYNSESHYFTRQINNTSVAFIRFSYGHSSEEPTVPSNGSGMMCLNQDRSKVKNSFIDGTYTNGTSSCSISNNIITINAFKTGQDNRPAIYFKYPLNIQTGDTVRVLITKNSGSVNGPIYIDAWVGGNKIINNKSWNTGNTALDQTLSSPGNNNNQTITFNNRTGEKTYTNYKCSIKIFVNGVQVLPEV